MCYLRILVDREPASNLIRFTTATRVARARACGALDGGTVDVIDDVLARKEIQA